MRLAHLMILPPLLALAACGGADDGTGADAGTGAGDGTGAEEAAATALSCDPPAFDVGESVELAPGLTATLVKHGYGRRAEAGDLVDVHYTGWFFDADAAENKGDKFDSSRDRGQPFRFALGAGRVIPGWDRGVECMMLGEQRIFTIAPEMAYGELGYPPVIPPDATLLFDVELLETRRPGE